MTKRKDFRGVAKVPLCLKIPPALARRVRRVALDREVSLCHAATEAFARWVGIDPGVYGIEVSHVE